MRNCHRNTIKKESLFHRKNEENGHKVDINVIDN